MQNIILTPSYTKEFKCIGGECEDSCCIGWRVFIDKNTFKNYKRIYNKEFKAKVDKYIKRNRHSTNENSYAQIKLLENERCPFLNNKNLCEVFINVGEHNLSKVCTEYPRIYNRIDSKIEKSLTLSCPVAAKKILLNKELMEFDEIQSNEKISNIINYVDTQSNKYINKCFWEIRIFTIDLLQNRNYSIEDRLIILGMFYKEISENSNVDDVIKKFKNRILDNVYKKFLNDISQLQDIKLHILTQIIDAKIENDLNIDREFLEFYYKTKTGLGYEKEHQEIDLVKGYNLCYKKYYKDFILHKEHIMENFLVNYVFQNTFPVTNKKLFDEYIIMVINYALIKVHLVGLSGYYKENFSEDIVVKFIQKFSKVVMHNYNYIEWIFNSIKDEKLDSMAHIIIFIKD
ncbi:flagellin lysine-N-methylase [Hathewaya limosa]|uniref:Lysine-N-methylase n=1 Tax=Hathewaya limosa TaxID=1536 RepID=A0ABU0JS26_HATLI|nr:flagellin lysine-N-methylase [Hathewaya limosa]MDQ0479245.1 lysine-N-methylase [Hathewaya limosa]